MKIRITGRGIYSVFGGRFQEMPVGTELDVGKIPRGWKERCVVVSDDAGKTPVNNPQEESAIEDLRAEAEAAGVTVDKRWGESRLRSEIEQA